MPLLIILLILFSFEAKAQFNSYANADNVALNIPRDQTNTSEDISAFINKHLNTDEQKVRAIYTWLTRNIQYDKNSLHRVILDEDNDQRVSFALKRKRGVCENFAAIFTDLCNKSGIASFVIEGYTKQGGSMDRSAHAWCAAFMNGNWFLYDPTWDAGFVRNGNFQSFIQTNYFQISPIEFIRTHIPFDPMWQFLNPVVSYASFSRNRVESAPAVFNFKDSINNYIKSDSLSRYLGSFSRIKNFDWPPSMIDTRLKQLKLEIELIYQDRDMAFYNSAVQNYNDAISIYNVFVNYKNNQFQPAKNDQEIKNLFTQITNKITTAQQKLKDLSHSQATLVLDAGDIAYQLKQLAASVSEQESFFKNYLAGNK
jgi:hypothetical protein